jgi:hypothetical protein
MVSLALTLLDMRWIRHITRHVLIDELEPTDDVRSFLMAGLRDDASGTAAKIAKFDESQIRTLWQQLAAASDPSTYSALFK